jgi:tripartite-type tricarboxylate transporter receptor subunit TctC
MMHPRCHGLLRAVLVLAAVLAVAPARAQEQPIRIIFPFAAGGSGDGLARLIADKMRGPLGRAVIVESRTGASGRLGVQAVKAAAPDGNTLLITPIAPVAIYQHVYPSLDYDPIADLVPLSQVATFDFGVAVGPQITAASLKDLVAWAKANPAQANYGIPAAGSLPHFLGVMFGRTTGTDVRAVPYRGSAAALTDLVGGQIAMVFTTTSDLAEMHKAGRIRMLATSDRARSPFVPEVPTFREAGYDLEATGWYGLFAPAKTPPDVVERLNKAIVAAMRMPEVQERMRAFGLQPTGTSARDFAEIQKTDSARWAPHVKASGFKPQD